MKKIDDSLIKSLYEKYRTPDHVIRHMEGVTNCALKIAKALNEHGHNLDLDLIYGAGMTHDIARTQDDHWIVAADELERLGFPREAEIVRCHMLTNEYARIDKISEREMILFGDRMVQEDRFVGIDTRFDYILNKAICRGVKNFSHTIENKKKMRFAVDEVEKEIGMTIPELMGIKVKGGKEKEVSFEDVSVRDFVENSGKNGLCFKKWRADVVTDLSGKDVGTLFEQDGKMYLITKMGKRCFEECELLKCEKAPCLLGRSVAFGEVIEKMNIKY